MRPPWGPSPEALREPRSSRREHCPSCTVRACSGGGVLTWAPGAAAASCCAAEGPPSVSSRKPGPTGLEQSSSTLPCARSAPRWSRCARLHPVGGERVGLVRDDRRLRRRLPRPPRLRPALQHLERRGALGTARRSQGQFNGLVDRQADPDAPSRVEYRLTALGRTLPAPIDAVGAWALSTAMRLWPPRKQHALLAQQMGAHPRVRKASWMPTPPPPMSRAGACARDLASEVRLAPHKPRRGVKSPVRLPSIWGPRSPAAHEVCGPCRPGSARRSRV